MAKEKKVSQNESMKDKVEYTGYKEEKEPVSIFGGMVALFLGLILLIVGIVFIVLFNLPARLDENMKAPKLNDLPEYSKEKSVKISGTAEEGNKVLVYVNGSEYKDLVSVNKDKSFELDYVVDKEGEYKIEVAAIKGFPVRYRSPKSSVETVVMDWTAPSKNVTFTSSKETNKESVKITGTADADSKVTIKNRTDNKEYSATADKDGKFEIKDVKLAKGDNTFNVEISDKAGNKVVLNSDLVIKYNTKASLNGDGATDLPESSGEISNFIQEMFANRLFTILGLLSLIVFAINTGLVVNKLRRESI